MKNSSFIVFIISIMISCSPKEKVVKMPDLKITLGKVEARSVFKNDSMSIWGASLVKGEDSLYHLFYSRYTTLGQIFHSGYLEMDNLSCAIFSTHMLNHL